MGTSKEILNQLHLTGKLNDNGKMHSLFNFDLLIS